MKPRLLLAWGNPYNFDGVIVPLVPRLAEVYDVHVLLVDYYLAPRVTEQLRRWQTMGTITGFGIVPEYEATWRLHGYMALLVRRLRRRRFQYFVSLSMMQVWERYLLARALPSQALRVCFFTHMTNLLEHESMVRELLEGGAAQAVAEPRAEPAQPLSARRALHRMARTPGIGERSMLALRYARALWRRLPLPRLPERTWHEWLDRYLLPAFLVGRIFPFQKLDRLTQLGTQQFDAVVFLDPLEARAHAALYGNPNMFVAKHPAHGNCRCDSVKGVRNAILSPLSGLMGSDTLSDEVLAMYLRDLGSALRESGAAELHLRLHPREDGKWPKILLEHLHRNGVPAQIVDSSQPIREVICDYAGVVGFASAALRDARGSCDHAFVVGMVAASRSLFPNPKFVFGMSEGIAWIEADGSFPPGIFRRTHHQAPLHPPLTSLLDELASRKNRNELQGDVKSGLFDGQSNR